MFEKFEYICRKRAHRAANLIYSWLAKFNINQSVPVIFLGTGWDVFDQFKDCLRLRLEEIDQEFSCLPQIEGHTRELVFVEDFVGGQPVILMRGRPHLYQKWFTEINFYAGLESVCLKIETSAKYLVRLHTEMMLDLAAWADYPVGPFIITSAVGSLSEEKAPVGSVVVPRGIHSLELDLPIQNYTVARRAICHDLRDIAMTCGQDIELSLNGQSNRQLEVLSGGLKQILGPGFEDPEFELLKETGCSIVGMSGATACHLIASHNEQKLSKEPVRAVLLCLVTDYPYKSELVEVSPFDKNTPWVKTHQEVLNLAERVKPATRQFLFNLVRQF